MNKEPIKIDKDRANSIIQKALAFFNGTDKKEVKDKFDGTFLSYNITDAAPVFVASPDGITSFVQGAYVYADAMGTTPYPDGTYTVDGTQFSFTVTAGVIANIVDATGAGPGQPVPQAAPQAPAAQAAPPQAPQMPAQQPYVPQPQAPISQPSFEVNLPDSYKAFKTAFGTDKETSESLFNKLINIEFLAGTPDERLTALETMMKACMKYCFGYEIERAQQQIDVNAAIETYKTKIESLDTQLSEHKKMGLELTDLFKEFLSLPSEEPKTISSKDKTKFERQQKTEERFEKIALSLKEARKEKV